MKLFLLNIAILTFNFVLGQPLSIDQTINYINKEVNEDLSAKENYYGGTKRITLTIEETKLIVKYIWEGNMDVLFNEFIETKINFNEISFDVMNIKSIQKKNYNSLKAITLNCNDGTKNCFKVNKEAIMWHYSNEFSDRPNALNHFDYIHLFYLNSLPIQQNVFNALSYLLYEVKRTAQEQSLENPFISDNDNTFHPSNREVIKLENNRGVFELTASIGGIDAKVIFDSGASDVSVPKSFEDILLKRLILNENNYLEPGLYTIADGSVVKGNRFIVPFIKVDGVIVKNVQCSTNTSENIILLGKTFLDRFKSWKIDNKFNQLILEY